MSRPVSAEVQDALEKRALVARDFISVYARNRSTGASIHDGMWSDVGTVSAEVVDPDTDEAAERTFYGAGTLISVSDIALVSSLTVQTVTVTMSQVHERVEQLVRTYDVKQARIEIFRGLFDPDTRLLVAPAECRFVGFVDGVEVRTPAENEEGAVVLTCVSHTQEMTRSNPDTRSHESQILRHPTDDFYRDVATVGEWEIWWGRESGKPV